MKKLLTCLFVAMFVVGLTMSGLGCAENQQGAKDKKCDPNCKKPCCEKKAEKCPPTCPKAAAAKTEAGAAQPAKPAPAPAPAPAKPATPAPVAQPAPQGGTK